MAFISLPVSKLITLSININFIILAIVMISSFFSSLFCFFYRSRVKNIIFHGETWTSAILLLPEQLLFTKLIVWKYEKPKLLMFKLLMSL